MTTYWIIIGLAILGLILNVHNATCYLAEAKHPNRAMGIFVWGILSVAVFCMLALQHTESMKNRIPHKEETPKYIPVTETLYKLNTQ